MLTNGKYYAIINIVQKGQENKKGVHKMKKLLEDIIGEIGFFFFMVWLNFNAVEVKEDGATNERN